MESSACVAREFIGKSAYSFVGGACSSPSKLFTATIIEFYLYSNILCLHTEQQSSGWRDDEDDADND